MKAVLGVLIIFLMGTQAHAQTNQQKIKKEREGGGKISEGIREGGGKFFDFKKGRENDGFVFYTNPSDKGNGKLFTNSDKGGNGFVDKDGGRNGKILGREGGNG